MPEYSSTTITPADSVKTPAMNGSTSGNYTLADLRAFILASKGLANGLASLDANGKLPISQLPELADDVLVYGSYALLPSPGTAGKLYITADDNKMYRWDDALATPDYVVLSVDLSAYATKAEVEAADTDLKNALQATNARVENLEQEHGSYYDVDVKSVYTVPSGKAKNWSVNVLRGVTRARNQKMLALTTTDWVAYSANATIANETGGGIACTYAGSSVESFDYGILYNSANKIHLLPSEVYLVSFEIYSPTTQYFKLEGYGGSLQLDKQCMANSWVRASVVITISSERNSRNLLYPTDVMTSGQTYKVRNGISTELKQYFGTSDLSFLGATDSAKLATIQSDYPELLIPSDYDAGSLVSTRYEGVVSKSKNLLDVDKWLTDRIGASGYTKNGNSYTFSSSSSLFTDTLVLFDTDTEFTISGTITAGTAVTPRITLLNSLGTALQTFYGGTPKTATGIGIRLDWSTSGSMTLTDIQIELGNTATSYSPYGTLATISLPTPITLRSAGSIQDELEVESGVVTKNVASVDLGSLTWVQQSENIYYCELSDMLQSNAVSLLLAKGYTRRGDVYSNWGDADKVFGTRNGYIRVYFKDTSYADASAFKSAMNGVYLNYELVTPTTEQLDPIQNPYLPTESGGTISSILTDAVDDSMTLGYINL